MLACEVRLESVQGGSTLKPREHLTPRGAVARRSGGKTPSGARANSRVFKTTACSPTTWKGPKPVSGFFPHDTFHPWRLSRGLSVACWKFAILLRLLWVRDDDGGKHEKWEFPNMATSWLELCTPGIRTATLGRNYMFQDKRCAFLNNNLEVLSFRVLRHSGLSKPVQCRVVSLARGRSKMKIRRTEKHKH